MSDMSSSPDATTPDATTTEVSETTSVEIGRCLQRRLVASVICHGSHSRTAFHR